jgi:hypothetical protein
MAVASAKRGRGTGTQLLTYVLEALAMSNVCLVEVKTLDQSADYEPFDGTRAFWEQRGFHHIDTIDPMPGWPPGNPAALYVAALRPTIGFKPSSLCAESEAPSKADASMRGLATQDLQNRGEAMLALPERTSH